MFVFILRRVLYAVPVLLGVCVVVFGLVQLVPGDAADILIPPEAPREVAAALRARLGLDQPVYIRFFLWLERVLVGDLGLSMFTGRPVGAELVEALANTMKLAIPAALLGFVTGTVLGAAAAAHRGSWLDRLFSGIAITGVSLPHYWTGIVLVAIFAVILNWLPAQGMGPAGFPTTIEQWRHLVLPVITLSLIPMGVISRLVRATTLEVLGQEFVAALHAKGLLDRRVAWHVAKNVAPPALALMGLQFGYLLSGSILVETVFNWPGSGGLMNLAIFRRDVPVLSATILVLAAIFVVINILVDILQAVIDPRIRR